MFLHALLMVSAIISSLHTFNTMYLRPDSIPGTVSLGSPCSNVQNLIEYVFQLTCFQFRCLDCSDGEISVVLSGHWVFMCGKMGVLPKDWMRPSLQTSLDGSLQ